VDHQRRSESTRLNDGDEYWGGSKAMFADWMRQFGIIADIRGAAASTEFQSELRDSLHAVIGKLSDSIWRKRRARLRQQWKVVRGFRLLAVV
jgi:hypothetical protein